MLSDLSFICKHPLVSPCAYLCAKTSYILWVFWFSSGHPPAQWHVGHGYPYFWVPEALYYILSSWRAVCFVQLSVCHLRYLLIWVLQFFRYSLPAVWFKQITNPWIYHYPARNALGVFCEFCVCVCVWVWNTVK